MEKLRNAQQRDINLLKVERDRTQLLVQTMKELNTHYNLYNRRATNAPPLAVHRVKVTFKDEPGEGTGVTRSFILQLQRHCLQMKNCLTWKLHKWDQNIHNIMFFES